MTVDPDHLPRRFASPLECARAYVGIKEDPKGSNRGPPHELFAIPGEDPMPWCARFVRYCFEQSGLRLPGNRYLIGRVETLHHEMDVRGALVKVPAPGDLVFYLDRGKSDAHKGGRHIGIVEEVHDNGTITTIEGNWSDAVVRRTGVKITAPDVWGFGRWPFQTSS